MRVPYVADSASKTDTEKIIVDRIKERRQPGALLDLDRALLHSPEVADGWNSFFGSIRERTSLSADIRELAICRVAILNKAQFEWCQHAPLAKEAGVDERGLRDEQNNGEGLIPEQKAVLRYTDEMTRNIAVSEATFKNLKLYFSDKQIVELTLTIGGYNCVSRFLVALDVGERNGLDNVKEWHY